MPGKDAKDPPDGAMSSLAPHRQVSERGQASVALGDYPNATLTF